MIAAQHQERLDFDRTFAISAPSAIGTILVPLDFFAPSRAAARYALALAERFRSQVAATMPNFVILGHVFGEVSWGADLVSLPNRSEKAVWNSLHAQDWGSS